MGYYLILIDLVGTQLTDFLSIPPPNIILSHYNVQEDELANNGVLGLPWLQ